MESECNHPSKRRYDITMSKRTRKPPVNLENSYHSVLDRGGESLLAKAKVDEAEEEEHKSLKQLINGDEKSKVVNEGEESKGRNSLGEHFTEEEKQLQLVKTQQQQSSVQGVKLKGMVSRYVKVLSHLIKVKRVGSRRKPLPRLTM